MMEEADRIEAELRERQRIDYDALLATAGADAAPEARALFEAPLPDCLARSWSEAYRRLGGSPAIVEVRDGAFCYLFDLSGERAIAAFGRVRKPSRVLRDRSRLAGFPPSLHSNYQKGLRGERRSLKFKDMIENGSRVC